MEPAFVVCAVLFPPAAVAAAAVKWAALSLLGAPRRGKLLLACAGIAVLEPLLGLAAFGAHLLFVPGGWFTVLAVEAALGLPPNIVVADDATRGAEGWRKIVPLLLAILAFPIAAVILVSAVPRPTVDAIASWALGK
jgi:hypothetical protein